MNKKILLLTLILFIVPQIYGIWCYQESANVSVYCTNIGNGTYSYTGTGIQSPQNMTDSNWNTCAKANALFTEYWFYANYTPPDYATNASIWKTNASTKSAYSNIINLPENNSIPSLCWNNMKISLASYGYANVTHSTISNYCYNGTSYQIITSNISLRNPRWTITTNELGDIGSTSAPTVFSKNNTLYLISGEDGGTFYGYNWSGSAWQIYDNITGGLGDVGLRSAPTVFSKNNTLYLISGKYYDAFYGYNWSGSAWQIYDNITGGLGDPGWVESILTVFSMNNTPYSILGDGNGIFHGYNWSGSAWQIYDNITGGLGDVGSTSAPTVFSMNNIFYLISGNNSGNFYGFKWSGSTWQSYNNITSGLNDVGSHSTPTAYNLSSTTFLITGKSTGAFDSYMWSDDYNISFCEEAMYWDNYTNKLDNCSTYNYSVINFSYFSQPNTLSYASENITFICPNETYQRYTPSANSTKYCLKYNETETCSINLNYQPIWTDEWAYSQSYSLNLSPDNILYYDLTMGVLNLSLIIKDESTNNLITDSVSLRFTKGSNESNYTTTTGYFSLLDESGESYSIFISSANYGSRIYTVTLENPPIQYLNIFLAANTSTTILTISDKDSTALLSDVLVTQYKIINNSWQAVESKYSDVTGRAQFSYVTNINYKFLMSKSGYQTYVFYLSPILFSSYDIGLTKDVTSVFIPDNYFISIAYSPSTFKNGTTANFGFIIGSPNGALSEYGINLGYSGSFNATYGTNSIGGQLNITLPISASLGDVMTLNYYYITEISGRRNFSVYLPITFESTSYNMTMTANRDNTYGLGIFERVLILVFITLGIIGISALIGQLVLGMALGLFVMGYLSFIGFIPIWLILISVFIGFFILSYKSGGQY